MFTPSSKRRTVMDFSMVEGRCHLMALMQTAHLASAWFVARLPLKSERGATAVEYAVMVALIAAVIILAVVFLGRTASKTFSTTGCNVSTSGAGPCP